MPAWVETSGRGTCSCEWNLAVRRAGSRGGWMSQARGCVHLARRAQGWGHVTVSEKWGPATDSKAAPGPRSSHPPPHPHQNQKTPTTQNHQHPHPRTPTKTKSHPPPTTQNRQTPTPKHQKRGQPRIELGASRIFDHFRAPEARIIPLDHYPESRCRSPPNAHSISTSTSVLRSLQHKNSR